jgi:hypothetical protein
MRHAGKAYALLPVPVLRRLTLAWLGFTAEHLGEWRRGGLSSPRKRSTP